MWSAGLRPGSSAGKRSLLYDDSQHCATFCISGSGYVARGGQIDGDGSGISGQKRAAGEVCEELNGGCTVGIANYGCGALRASTRPPMVCGWASTVGSMPCSRRVDDVMGPMEVTFMWVSASLPAAAMKFVTVDELVKVIQCGLRSRMVRARSASPSGATVR